jgi:hypothetical protein
VIALTAGWLHRTAAQLLPASRPDNGRIAACDHDEAMTQSTRKLLGTLLILGSLVVWSILWSWIYMALLGDAPWWGLIIYFCIAGSSWFFPATWIIRWMSRP